MHCKHYWKVKVRSEHRMSSVEGVYHQSEIWPTNLLCTEAGLFCLHCSNAREMCPLFYVTSAVSTSCVALLGLSYPTLCASAERGLWTPSSDPRTPHAQKPEQVAARAQATSQISWRAADVEAQIEALSGLYGLLWHFESYRTPNLVSEGFHLKWIFP